MTADPRPFIGTDEQLAGSRCPSCRRVVAPALPRCPRCSDRMEPSSVDPVGTVWSSTVVWTNEHGDAPAIVLSYVDITDGPRVLARCQGTVAVPIDAVVQLSTTADGMLALVEFDAPGGGVES